MNKAIKSLRTPESRFAHLPDFPFEPTYVENLPGYEGLRAHYLDLGPKDAPRTFLCLHGEPTWCYLYRKMIPILLESGARVVAPDFFGFGRSDKPIDEKVYSFHFHRNYLLMLIKRLNLDNITLVGQDWGGTLGLTLPVELDFQKRLKRLILMNTALPDGDPAGPHFYQWRALVRSMPDPPVGQLIRHITPLMSEQEMNAYDAPFPDITFKAGARTFPELGMVEPYMEGVDEAKAAQEFWKNDWSGETFMAIGAKDADVDSMHKLRKLIKGCPAPFILADADHFVPEWGTSVARAALTAFGDL